jgi:hypothetical protein
MPNVAQAIVNLTGAGLRRLERRWRIAARELGRAGRRARRQQEIWSQAPLVARRTVTRGAGTIERSIKRVERFGDHVITPYRVERRVKRELARAAASGRPVIVGPWTSEVGYEALYWVPFLHWAVDRYGLRPDRVIAVSRGGTHAWYRGVADRYVEIFDLVDPREFASEAAARRDRGDQKQMALTEFDRAILSKARTRAGAPDAVVWYPGLMYQLFRAFWHGDRAVDFVHRHTDHAAVKDVVSGIAGPTQLPAEYAAVKFYTGQAIPDTERNREALVRFVERLAARIPVVLLDTAWSMDEHRDFAFDGIPGVTTLRPSLDPAGNLGLQTSVIARASLFLGTCGGLAWLAPLMGVNTIAVYEDDRHLNAHLYAARLAYRRTGAAPFSAMNLNSLRALDPAGSWLCPHTIRS